MSTLAEKILTIHHALDEGNLPHAFGGALALAWCTENPRTTADIDLNVFVSPRAAARVMRALPDDVEHSEEEAQLLRREGLVRVRWERTPVDLFLNVTPFHDEAMRRIRFEPFDGDTVPFLTCNDLAVFKVFLDRRRDWVDLEDMLVARALDVEAVARVIATYLGEDDDRLGKLRALEQDVLG